MKSNINIINPSLLINKKDKLIKIKSPRGSFGNQSNKILLINKNDKTNSFSIINLSSSPLINKENFSPSLSPQRGEERGKDIKNLPFSSFSKKPFAKGKINKDKKKQVENLSSQKQITSLISLLETNSKFSNQFKGIQFKLAGRLKGAQRAKSILLSHGRISTQTFNSSLKFNKKQINTKWGTWGSSIYISRTTS